jgi:YVTN family beta-propeller protein
VRLVSPTALLLLATALSPAVPRLAHAQPARAFRTEPGGPELEVGARVATGVQPKSVGISPDGTRVVVCNFGRPDVDNVFVYDSNTLARVGVVQFPGNAVESAFSPDGRTLYVSNFARHLVEVIDFATLRITAEIPVGRNPKTIAVSPDGVTLYVANYFGRSISVVDARALREVRRLPTGSRPRGMGVLPDGTLLGAAFGADLVHVFPPGSAAESARWSVCRYPRDIVPSRNGVFFMTCSLGHIGFYRASDAGVPFGIGFTGRNPRSIGVTRDGRYVGVANFSSSDVSLIDVEARTHRRIAVPRARRIVGLAMHPDSSLLRVYATSWDTNELILLRPRS